MGTMALKELGAAIFENGNKSNKVKYQLDGKDNKENVFLKKNKYIL